MNHQNNQNNTPLQVRYIALRAHLNVAEQQFRQQISDLEARNRQWANENIILAAGWETEQLKIERKDREIEELKREKEQLKKELEEEKKKNLHFEEILKRGREEGIKLQERWETLKKEMEELLKMREN